MSELHLPPAGSSTVSRFFFRTRKSQKEFRARVLVLFRGRVLQTAILRRAVGESRPDTAVPGLEPETTVRASFEGLSPSRAFDAAIVINHSASGTPGASVITPNSAQFLEPVGLPASLDALRNILTSLTKLAQPPSQLKDDQMVKVLRQLANHGRLMERMFSTANDALSKAHRIQVVEAVRGAFLPVEFFYDGAAPLNSAKLCTGAVAELGDKKDDKNNSEKPPCANPDSNKYTCPTHFWGFSRVVERYTHRNLNRGVYELSEPSQERAKLDVLSRAIVATSAKVSSSDAKKVLDAAKSACGSAEFAQDFDELESKVAATSPTLIILLPHSLPDPDVEGMAALELGDQIRNSAQIDKQHVLGPRSQTGPVVLLLGCSTKLTVVPYQTFVESFKDAGASVVLATMSVIRGRHAAPFTKDLLESIQSCAASGTAVFGDAVLATRRKLLAQGNPFVLTLTAYGDAEWLI